MATANPTLTLYRVKSLSKPGVVYTIQHFKRTWFCSCPDSVYRGRQCKHVILIKLIQSLSAGPHASTIDVAGQYVRTVMSEALQFCVFLGLYLLVAAVWRCAIELGRIADWIERDR